MPLNLFEESTLTLGARIKRGVFKPSEAKFKFELGEGADGTIDEQSVKISKDAETTVEVQLPKVKTDAASYTLKYTISAGKDTYQPEGSFVVWPRQITVKVVDDKAKAVPGLPLTAVQGGGIVKSKVETDEQGSAAFHLSMTGKVAFSVSSPFSIVKDEVEKKRQLEVKRAPFQLAILAPDYQNLAENLAPLLSETEKKWRQYVNLAAKDGENWGSKVTFTVGAKGDLQKDPAERKHFGVEGEKVYIQVQFGDKNSKRNDPKPALLVGGVEVAPESDKRTFKSEVDLPKDGSFATFEVELGKAGLDVCTVKVGITEGCEDDQVELTSWRKLYYQVTRPTALAKPDLAAAEKAYADVGVAFEEYEVATAILPEDEPASAWIDGAIIEKGATGKKLVIGTHNAATFKTYYDRSRSPAAHIIFCDYQLDANKAAKDATVEVMDGDEIPWPPPSGGKVPGVTIEGSALGASDKVFSIALHTGADSVKKCSYRNKTKGTGWKVVPRDHVMIDQAELGNTIYIKATASGAKLLGDGDTLEFKISVYTSLGWYNGWCTSGDNHNVIKAGRPAPGINGTIVHEVGHAVGQAIQSPPPGLEAAKGKPLHPWYYTNNRGHSGSHCAFGVDEKTYKDANKPLDTSEVGKKCTCIMYGAGTDKRNQKIGFCEHCQPFVKAVDIGTVTT